MSTAALLAALLLSVAAGAAPAKNEAAVSDGVEPSKSEARAADEATPAKTEGAAAPAEKEATPAKSEGTTAPAKNETAKAEKSSTPAKGEGTAAPAESESAKAPTESDTDGQVPAENDIFGNCSGLEERRCDGSCQWVRMPTYGEDFACVPAAEYTTELHIFFAAFAVHLLIGTVFARVYHSKVVSEIPVVGGDTAFPPSRNRRIFACFLAPATCALTTFCLPVVYAKNCHVAKVRDFWQGFLLFYLVIFILCVSPLYVGSTACMCVLTGAWILNDKMTDDIDKAGGVADPCSKCWRISFWVPLFMPCEVGRQSLDLDEALGVTTTGCYYTEHRKLEQHPREERPQVLLARVEDCEKGVALP